MLINLHTAVAAVAPIIGVEQYSDGRYGVNFTSEATDEQRAAGQAIADAWIDPPTPRLVYSLDFWTDSASLRSLQSCRQLNRILLSAYGTTVFWQMAASILTLRGFIPG